MSSVLGKVREDLCNFDENAIKADVEKALAGGVRPLQIVDVLSETMKEIGDRFARLELFLTDLMMAGDTMKAALNLLLPKIRKEDIPVKGKVVLGTVKGDIHDIGKNIVSALLTASGFEVVDLGKDVPATKFVEEAERVNADVVAASALMTTTMAAMKDLVDYFKARNLREKYRLIVGGGPVTKYYAEEIGADGYGQTAVEAVEIVAKLAKKK